jgi:ABC-type branched-subunit amino acid transport system ATPase component
MLSVRNLSFSYGAIPTLRGINMEMARGRVT